MGRLWQRACVVDRRLTQNRDAQSMNEQFDTAHFDAQADNRRGQALRRSAMVRTWRPISSPTS